MCHWPYFNEYHPSSIGLSQISRCTLNFWNSSIFLCVSDVLMVKTCINVKKSLIFIHLFVHLFVCLFVCLFVDSFVSFLAYSFVCLLIHSCQNGQSVSRSVGRSVGQSVSWSVNQSVSHSESVTQSVNQSVSQSCHRPSHIIGHTAHLHLQLLNKNFNWESLSSFS